jgi:predicted phage terminase large subunit-like protein
LHFVAWLLAQDPALQIVYAMYGATIAQKKSRKAREYARLAGVPIAEDASSRADWRTGIADGGVWACGVEGALTGEGADIIIVDDPVKDRAAAESALQRQAVYDWWNDVGSTRAEPSASFIVCLARWHQDDLGGRLIEQGWEHLNLRALDEQGRALWPARFDATHLEKIREERGLYTWASLYQGEPQAKGGQVFAGDAITYDALPEAYALAGGVDLAYSERTHADYSVAVILARAGDLYFVVDCVRVQETAPKFQARLAALQQTYPTAVWRSYLAGTEKGTADLMGHLGTNVGAEKPIGDKFLRSQPVAAKWNAGKIFVPKAAHWLNAFLEEIKSFTGVKDRHDDIVDALAAAHDALVTSNAAMLARQAADTRLYASLALNGGPMFAPYAKEALNLPPGMTPEKERLVLERMAGGDPDPYESLWSRVARAQQRDREAAQAARAAEKE